VPSAAGMHSGRLVESLTHHKMQTRRPGRPGRPSAELLVYELHRIGRSHRTAAPVVVLLTKTRS